jgi:hypothetical protein
MVAVWVPTPTAAVIGVTVSVGDAEGMDGAGCIDNQLVPPPVYVIEGV